MRLSLLTLFKKFFFLPLTRNFLRLVRENIFASPFWPRQNVTPLTVFVSLSSVISGPSRLSSFVLPLFLSSKNFSCRPGSPSLQFLFQGSVERRSYRRIFSGTG